jgi:hypothetical protein
MFFRQEANRPWVRGREKRGNEVGPTHYITQKENCKMAKNKNGKNKKPIRPWRIGDPFISVFIDDPQEGQVITTIPHTATGTTICANGAYVQSMGRQVNRTTNPPLNGNPKVINPPYGNWSTVLDNTDCPTSGGYTLNVNAVDGKSGKTYGKIVDFIVP